MIPSHLTARLREADVPALVGDYVRLRKSGQGRMVGQCPFHRERTASFTVWRDHWHCFGCGASGNAVGFLMRIEGSSFPEAAQALADRMGISLEEKPLSKYQQQAVAEEAALCKWWWKRRQEGLQREIYRALPDEEGAECFGRMLQWTSSLAVPEKYRIFKEQVTTQERQAWTEERDWERRFLEAWMSLAPFVASGADSFTATGPLPSEDARPITVGAA